VRNGIREDAPFGWKIARKVVQILALGFASYV